MVSKAPTGESAITYTKAVLSPTQLSTLKSLRHAPLNEIRHNKINDACPDTLGWFLDDEGFRSWRDSSKASSFWIHGSPGHGKSVLAKFITKHLEDHSETLPTEKIATISFFCYRQEDQPVDILRALILQLIDCQELFEYLPDRYREHPSEFSAAPFSVL
jgi:Cdc6-like AAA superfamily ATPase